MRVSYRKLNIKTNARELASKVHADTAGASLVIGGCGNRYISLPLEANARQIDTSRSDPNTMST